MRQLLVIFAVVSSHSKGILISILLFALCCFAVLSGWIYIDYEEVRLRNQVIAQQETVKLVYDLMPESRQTYLQEEQKLIDYKRQYDNLRGSWLGSVILNGRPNVNVKLIISDKTQELYKD